MSSSICTRFTQNTWRKDLCSNCFKSKDEHNKTLTTTTTAAALKTTTTTTFKTTTTKATIATNATIIQKTERSRNSQNPKGIMKSFLHKNKNCKVSFPKDLTQIIGYGGEWSDSDGSEDEITPINANDDLTSTDDEDHQALVLLTKTNTDFNTNNGNLLGDPEENIKKSFAALRLGTPQLDAEGKKQTLKISVTPFGTAGKMFSSKAKFGGVKKEDIKIDKRKKDNNVSAMANSKKESRTSKLKESDSPPVERAMKKSLLEEISETLEKQQQKEVKASPASKTNKIKFEITSLSSGPMPNITSELKKTAGNNSPITKEFGKSSTDQISKPAEDNKSDSENGISAYYDVVENNNGYENLPDGQNNGKDYTDSVKKSNLTEDKSMFSSSQYITDMLLSTKTHAASYSLREGSFITSKITSDGLIVTKCSSDDPLDSTGSSFDGSSDEETSYNMNRSESDSGIGISITADYKPSAEIVDKQAHPSNSSSDYEDIQVAEENAKKSTKSNKIFPVEKSRELAGEPDGSADPDGNLEAPALPKSPPPLNAEARSSFLHDLHKNIPTKKPEVPAKPIINVMKSFSKRPMNSTDHQPVNQLQPIDDSAGKQNAISAQKENTEYSKLLRKGRAPKPPSAEETVYNSPTFEGKNQFSLKSDKELSSGKKPEDHFCLYTRNPIGGTKSNSPVIREKDKRERATINPKFRSLNTLNSNRRTEITKVSSPETTRKNLSMSEECLLEEKKKKKFSIKKFLRMGTSKTTDNLCKKEGIYSEIVTGEESGITGKPRLVIIHPIDINPTAVEVVKEVNKTTTSAPEVLPAIVTGKPPPPPQRACSETNRYYELNKPGRPPPPKSVELRRKQKIGFNVNITGSVKSKADNVYANLGEIRSAIAPRKPERTASMREREAQMELMKKRQEIENSSSDTLSVCSSNGGNSAPTIENSPSSGSSTAAPKESRLAPVELVKTDHSSLNRKNTEGIVEYKLARVETEKSSDIRSKQQLSDGLKNSVLKINSTIDSYLKDKREYESLYDAPKKSPTITSRSIDNVGPMRNTENKFRFPNRSSLQDAASISGASCTRSECGPRYTYYGAANIPRVVSVSYCGSEMGESDIYSPYSFYGSEASEMTNDANLNDGLWGIQSMPKTRAKITNRLRMRKGRSVVHKSIEDNYSAVVAANHEALAQVLDQLQQSPIISQQLRPLANVINLRFEDFTIIEGVQAFVVGKRAFHAAIWTTVPITLALTADCNQISGVGGELNQLSGGISGALNPITEFCDLVPNYHLPLMPSTEVRMLQATISVFPRMQLDTLQSIGTILKSKSQNLDKHHISNFRGSIPNLTAQKEQRNLRNVCSVQNLSALNEERATEKIEEIPSSSSSSIPGMPSFDDVMCREIGFIMLQLVNGLKNLQAKGTEEIPITLSNVVLCKEAENKEAQARLCVLQGANQDEEEPTGTLCKCAHVALSEMLPETKLTPILSQILLKERSESLSKAKSVLEFVLWGPSDVALTGSTKERELALQRWLDLERATVLHGLVRTRVELTVYDECHLMFLVRSNAKIMNEAAKIVSDFNLTDI